MKLFLKYVGVSLFQFFGTLFILFPLYIVCAPFVYVGAAIYSGFKKFKRDEADKKRWHEERLATKREA